MAVADPESHGVAVSSSESTDPLWNWSSGRGLSGGPRTRGVAGLDTRADEVRPRCCGETRGAAALARRRRDSDGGEGGDLCVALI
jgi:hypothetical protein